MSKKYKDGRDDTPNAPNAGLTLHPEKAAHDQKQGRAGLNKPEAGGHVREQKRDDTVPNPQGGDAPIPKEHLIWIKPRMSRLASMNQRVQRALSARTGQAAQSVTD